MELLSLDVPLPTDLHDPVLVVALDGWTDAGAGGTRAATELLRQLDGTRLGAFDPDGLFDYRDRRPLVPIRQGVLGTPEWPELTLELARPGSGPDLLVVTGAEPDLSWEAVGRDLLELAHSAGVERSIGLGSVPGPIPHTRPSRLIVTSTDDEVFDLHGRPHEEVVVPGSCQVVLEAVLGAAGIAASGFWVRIPHYVATDYPEASRLLLDRLGRYLAVELELDQFDAEIADHRRRLDVAADGSPDVQSHISMLEEAYDSEQDEGQEFTGPLPTGDQIAEELERFLRDERG
jgi:hypothetical protein